MHGTLIILNQLYHLLAKGGYVIIDDFHLSGCRTAVFEFRYNNNITSPIMPIPNDYIMACSLFSTSSKCTNLKRRLTLIEDIIHQRGDSSLMYRRLAPQGIYWIKD